MITNPHEFFKRIRKYFKSIGAKENEILIAPVTYLDKRSPFAHTDNSPYELFLKDLSFQHQSEIRIIINSKNPKVRRTLRENNNIIDIGNIEDIAHIEGFYFEDMAMELVGNVFRYALAEPKIHPINELPKEELMKLRAGVMMGNVKCKDINADLKLIDDVLREKYDVHHLFLNGEMIY